MTKAEVNLEVEVVGTSHPARTNYLKGDEVLRVIKNGKARLSVFGHAIPATHSLSNKDSSGGVYLWDENGKSKEGKALSGQKILVGGRCIRPGETIELSLDPGSEIEIGIAGTQKSEYQMFEDLGTAQEGEVLKIKGVGVNI